MGVHRSLPLPTSTRRAPPRASSAATAASATRAPASASASRGTPTTTAVARMPSPAAARRKEREHVRRVVFSWCAEGGHAVASGRLVSTSGTQRRPQRGKGKGALAPSKFEYIRVYGSTTVRYKPSTVIIIYSDDEMINLFETDCLFLA